ncbi:hypothetical protein GNI_182230 [Gregarina niphandrodes]|uniref:Uncharacterized protein n=1 Tax=Gregarina niphandrodes TaxID=110365 RepID=A0A023AWW7_GRENI|nr:hypothetical protein GNI_182230 [Gregarina niphandrodes]EZG43214.1 hypothetical protein GNI_182230 [Gregarina niphandrodes]|eukprot:XP_011133530.1 hypothetical protein GNI_182230 [Gregarina niphandrodes]
MKFFGAYSGNRGSGCSLGKWGAVARVTMPFCVNGEWVDMIKAFEWLTPEDCPQGEASNLLVTKLLKDAFKAMENLPDLEIGSQIFPATQRELTAEEVQVLRATYQTNNGLRGYLLRSVAECLYTVKDVATKTRPPQDPDSIRKRCDERFTELCMLERPGRMRLKPSERFQLMHQAMCEENEASLGPADDWVEEFDAYLHTLPPAWIKFRTRRTELGIDLEVGKIEDIQFLPSTLALLPAANSQHLRSFGVVCWNPCSPREYDAVWQSVAKDSLSEKLPKKIVPLISFDPPGPGFRTLPELSDEGYFKIADVVVQADH